jgi:hypothetical protein
MALDYTYYRPATAEDDLSAYFADRLGLVRSDEREPFPLHGDRWWATHRVDSAEEYDEEAERLGLHSSGQLAIVVFELRKFLSPEEDLRAHIDLYGAVVDQLNETSGLTGLLLFGDISVLIERPPGGPTFLDTSLADLDGGNQDHQLDPVLNRGIIAELVDFI